MHHFEKIIRDFEKIIRGFEKIMRDFEKNTHLSEYLSDSVLLEQPYIFSDGFFHSYSWEGLSLKA